MIKYLYSAFRSLLIGMLLLNGAALPAYAAAYTVIGDCMCPTQSSPNVECTIDEELEINSCICSNPGGGITETGSCVNYQQVPEMSAMLVPAFLIAGGAVAVRARKRAMKRK